MTVWCVGSVNVDHSYRVGHLPRPGETLAAMDYRRGLGGKGANQSIAAARAGASVRHLGAIGGDGAWTRDLLAAEGVDVSGIAVVAEATGHAVILVDDASENLIVIHPGANAALTAAQLEPLRAAAAGDWLILQNETPLQAEAAAIARAQGLSVAYSAAPFDVDAAKAMLGLCDLLLVNEGEAAALRAALGAELAALGPRDVVVTRGALGVDCIRGDVTQHVPAVPVRAVDSTGAGDCFAGNLVACLDRGESMEKALGWAVAAAAIQVSRPGTAEAMPHAEETRALLQGAGRRD